MMSATLAQLSLGITRTGVKVFVPKHDLAYLMYYLRCVTRDMGLDVLDDDLVYYKDYRQLTNERRACVLEYARQYHPGELINKILFRDDDKIITKNFKNEFCDISVACGIVSVEPDILIAGKMQSVTKVMFYQQSWLDEHYYRPMNRAEAQNRRTNPFFKGIALYLAPLLYVTALFLSVFVFLSPAVMLHDQVALLTIAATAAQAGPTDGFRFFLGALGSCSKQNQTAQVQCTKPDLHPVYDLSIFPASTPQLSIPAAALGIPSYIVFSFGCAFAFFVMYMLTAYRRMFEGRGMQKLIAFFGILGFLIGIGSFVWLYKSHQKSILAFNAAVQDSNYKGPQFAAGIGNGFIMLWVAYGFYGLAILVNLTKLATHAERRFWRA